MKNYNVIPPFIHKGFHAYFYPIDFVQLIWNRWGKFSGHYYKIHISALHNNYWDLYYIPREFTALRNHYLEKINKNKDYLKKHYRNWKKSCIKLSKLIEELDNSFKNNESFLKTFTKYKNFIKEYIFEYALAAPVQEACGFQPEQWINPLLEEFCQKYKLDYQETSALLTSPVVHSFITEEEIELLKINLAYKKNKDKKKLQKSLLNLQKKWFWIQNNYATIKSIQLEELEKRFQENENFTLQEIQEKIHHLENIPSEKENKKKILFQKYKPESKLKLYIKIIELFAEMQDVRKSFVLRANHYHKLFLETVSLKYQQSLDNLWYYSYNELSNAIKMNSFLENIEIEKRKKMIVEVESKKEKIILSGNEAKYFFDKLQESVSDVTEFRGIVAQPGIVQGRAVIVLKSHDLLKVSAGDILVSSMTRPEMTIAMQKAAGFVTDEGGITSHAAIVSRELKKPCIIGTKIATKVLQSGDLVEIDANKGIVKIIKRG